MLHSNPYRWRRIAQQNSRNKTLLRLESLEDRTLLANGQWIAWFNGIAPASDLVAQRELGIQHLQHAGVSTTEVRIMDAMDLHGAFRIETPVSATEAEVNADLQSVPGFTWIQDYTAPALSDFEKTLGKVQRSLNYWGPFDYDTFLSREKNGEIPDQSGAIDQSGQLDALTNNNAGNGGTGLFTQSETDVLAYNWNGTDYVIVGYNDSGSNAGGTNKFTGFSRSTDGGLTFTDGGTLPTNAGGDAGDPVFARDIFTNRIYYATLGFSVGTIQVFRSDDNAATWMAPTVGTPGGASEDKQWMVVDNFGAQGQNGQGNVYLLSRNFGGGNGVRFYRSTDGGQTFGPSGGTLMVTGNQGAFVTVGPDHSVYCFWFQGTSIQMRKSTDQGLTFGAPVTVFSGIVGGTNGDHALTGIRQGTASASGFRSNAFPHVAVNPISGHLYAVIANDGAGADRADIFVTVSTDGGATWGAPQKVNDDVGTTDQWQPTIAVSTDGGKLGVFYYSRQEDPANNLFKYYGRIATISGGTLSFLPSFPISDVASLPEFGRDSLVNSVYMGDYDHAVATPGAFHVVWSDNRDDLPTGSPRKDPNVYYEKIQLGLAVATTNPAVGSIIATQPTVFTVNVSDPVQAATVDASDFTVNGIPADSVAYTPGSLTLTFTFNTSPVTTQGLQTMHIAAGAFARDPDNNPVFEFTGTFRYDLLALQVTSTNPPAGGVFTLPAPLTLDVNFNEPVLPGSVAAGDLLLSGIPGAFVSNATVLAGDTTVRFTIDGLTTEGTLTANINGGTITDPFGNPNNPFTANYEVDFGTVAYPVPLTVKSPAGALIYDPTVVGRVNVGGDTDSFTINVDAGQTITLLMRPTQATLQPTMTLLSPSNAVLASSTAAAPNQNALIQTVSATTAGVYTVSVSGAGGTIGNYTVQLILNAALESEGTLAGGNNNNLANAQDLAGSLISMTAGVSSATRAAIMGVSDDAGYSAAAVPFAFENISGTGTVIAGLTNADDPVATINPGFSFNFYGSNFTSFGVSGNGLITFGGTSSAFTNTDLTTSPTLATIAPFWDDLHTGGGVTGSNVFFQVTGAGIDQHLTIQWNNIRFLNGGTTGDTITFQAQLFADGRIRFNYQDLVSGTAAGNNGGSATVGIKAAGTQGPNRLLLAFNNGPNAFVGTGLSTLISPPSPTADYFSLPLVAGQAATIGATALGSGNLTVELRDAADNLLATSTGGATNVSQLISNFVAPTTGTYYLRLTANVSLVPYTMFVTRNAAFDTEANDTQATAQALGAAQGAIGSILPGAGTVYQASGVPFAFENISTTGTIITALDAQDDAAASIPIGFTFNFYNTNYTSVGVSTNGLITFGGTDATFTNADLISSPALAGIAPFWDDLEVFGSGTSHVYFQTLGSGSTQRLVIQWNQVNFLGAGSADTLTFQAVLFADGSIRFNYQDLVSGSQTGNNGASATVGLKDAGTQGPNRLLLAFNNGPNAFVGTGQSTLVTLPPAEDWYSFTATTASQILIQSSTPGDGPGEPGVLLNPKLELYAPNGTLLLSGASLADGRNELIKIHKAAASGTYRLRVMAEGGSSGDYFVGVTVRPANRGSGPQNPFSPESPLSDLGRGSAVVQAVLPKNVGSAVNTVVAAARGTSNTLAAGKVASQPATTSAARASTAVSNQALTHFLTKNQAPRPTLDDAAIASALVDVLKARG